MQLFLSISSNFGAVHSWNVSGSLKSRKVHWNPYFCGSRSFKVIDVGTPLKVVSCAGYNCIKSVSVCDRFHAKRANSGEIVIS